MLFDINQSGKFGQRRHSELGPNLLMDNEANFAILMRVDFKSEVGGF
jgi:hypothetical protein